MINGLIIALVAILFFIVFIAIGYFAMKQNIENKKHKTRSDNAMNEFNEMRVELEVYYRNFVIDQIERERNLREAEEKHSAIFSASRRPFQKRNLPLPNASFDEIVDVTGINSFEECDKSLLYMNPYRAIIDKTYSRRTRALVSE